MENYASDSLYHTDRGLSPDSQTQIRPALLHDWTTCGAWHSSGALQICPYLRVTALSILPCLMNKTKASDLWRRRLQDYITVTVA